MVVWAVSLSTMDLIIHSLSTVLNKYGIRSLFEFGKDFSPLAHSVLYPHIETYNALPK